MFSPIENEYSTVHGQKLSLEKYEKYATCKDMTLSYVRLYIAKVDTPFVEGGLVKSLNHQDVVLERANVLVRADRTLLYS